MDFWTAVFSALDIFVSSNLQKRLAVGSQGTMVISSRMEGEDLENAHHHNAWFNTNEGKMC